MLQGVSVFHLQTVLTDEVKNFHGYDDDSHTKKSDRFFSSFCCTTATIDDTAVKQTHKEGTKRTIYALENLNKKPGLIRRKGERIKCPRDGKLGAAYVDCLSGDDHVGPPNLMISYSWGNTFEEIVEVLVMYCDKKNLPKRRTYVWICCLCNNQHRVVENRKLGIDVPFEEFEYTFQSKVLGIGNVVSLLTPWEAPIYLTRVWCIFELYTAANAPEEKCKLVIEMPRATREKFELFLFNTDSPSSFRKKIYGVLDNTKIEAAEASVASDKVKILKIVEEGGGFNALNNSVNALLRDWIIHVLKDIFEEIKNGKISVDCSSSQEEEGDGNRKIMSREQIFNGFMNIGSFFLYSQQLDLALECNTEFHEFCVKQYGEEQIKIASALNSLMAVHCMRKRYDEAIEYGQKCLEIKKKEHGIDHLEIATTYYNLGRIYFDKAALNDAYTYYSKALEIREAKLGQNHEKTAMVYHEIGFVLYDKKDYCQSLQFYEKAIAIKEKLVMEKDGNGIKPSLANTYNNIALVYASMQENKKRLAFHSKALDIRLNILGEDHPSTKKSREHIKETYEALGDNHLQY